VLDTKFIPSKLTKKALRQQTQTELHNIDKEEDLSIDTNTSTATNIRRANRSRDDLLFTSTTLREETYEETTNRKIEKPTKDSDKVQQKMHRISSRSKKHNKKIQQQLNRLKLKNKNEIYIYFLNKRYNPFYNRINYAFAY